MNDNNPLGWFVLRTEAHRERRAELALLELGFDAYLPVETRWVTHARTRRQADKPLLPRYLFVQIEADMPHAFHMIREADGVEGFVIGAASHPRPIPGSWVGEMRQAQVEGAFDRTRKVRWTKFKPGQSVKPTEGAGAFVGILATVIRYAPKDRVRVLLSMFGRETEVEIEQSDLEAA